MTTEFLLRILVATLLGGIIGMEREYRAKEAGFRTHFLVALGAALFMILSAHGFEGTLISENHRLDVSRVAAQVVSGIGFIGAGTIIFQKHVVRGLTTAAGLWVTAAIGMTSGAGLYTLAISATVLVLISLEALNWILSRVGERMVTITFTTLVQSEVKQTIDALTAEGIAIDNYRLQTDQSHEGKFYRVSMDIRVKRGRYENRITDLMNYLDNVTVEKIE